MTIEELETNVLFWAEDRNLIEGSEPIRQMAATIEECSEVLQELTAAKANTYRPTSQAKRRLALEYGDVLVTLIIGMAQCSLSIEECLEPAYNKIKDRKGRMIDGRFVKEEDLDEDGNSTKNYNRWVEEQAEIEEQLVVEKEQPEYVIEETLSGRFS